jgi:hypothetical protein
MVPRLVHLERTTPLGADGEQVGDSVALAAVSIQVAAETITSPDFRASPTAETQLNLPLRIGGLGLRLPGSRGGEGQVARLSSIMFTQQALSRGAAALRRPTATGHAGGLAAGPDRGARPVGRELSGGG